jgi:hypothetical protein
VEGGRGHDRLVSWDPGRQLEQQRVQCVGRKQEHERPVEREQQHRFSSRKPLQADAGPISAGSGRHCFRQLRRQRLVLGTTPTARAVRFSCPPRSNGAGKKSAGRSLMPPPRPDGLWPSRSWPTAGCGGGSFGRISSPLAPAQLSALVRHRHLPPANKPPPGPLRGTDRRPTGGEPRSCRPQ